MSEQTQAGQEWATIGSNDFSRKGWGVEIHDTKTRELIAYCPDDAKAATILREHQLAQPYEFWPPVVESAAK